MMDKYGGNGYRASSQQNSCNCLDNRETFDQRNEIKGRHPEKRVTGVKLGKEKVTCQQILKLKSSILP